VKTGFKDSRIQGFKGNFQNCKKNSGQGFEGSREMLKNYQELQVWQRGYKLCFEIYQITGNFPQEEKYGLTSQIRRGILAGTVLSFARALGEFGATLMLAGNIPGKTDTMPLAIYSLAGSGEWSQANGMVLLLTFMSGLFLYCANRYSKRII
jgi:hypothetical protein